MYKVGTFSQLGRETVPGVYSKLSSVGGSSSISSAVYGGIALPWITMDVASRVRDPFEVNAVSLGSYAATNHLEYPETFSNVAEQLLRNANSVYVCPYTRKIPGKIQKDHTWVVSEGWSEDGNIHVEVVYTEKTDKTNRLQPLKVGFERLGNGNYTAHVYFPWQATPLVSNLEFTPPDIADGGAPTKKPVFTQNQEAGGSGYLYAIFGGADKLGLKISVKSGEILSPTTVMVGGGYAQTDDLKARIDTIIGEKHDGVEPGVMLAFEGKTWVKTSFDPATFMEDNTISGVFCIKGIAAPAGPHNFAVAELFGGKMTVTLYVHDEITGKTKSILLEEQPYEVDDEGKSKTTVGSILASASCIEKLGDAKAEWNRVLEKDAQCRIGFSSFHPKSKKVEESEIKDAMISAGKSVSGLIYFVPDRSLFLGDRSAQTKIYQQIQKEYLKNLQDICPTTQLIMDETWLPKMHEWNTGTKPLTLSNPFCVSTAGDSRGGTFSLWNSACLAGIMARCAETRNATAFPFPSDGDLVHYSQEVLEHMLDEGVMTYHTHMGVKMVYIDTSSYREKKGSSDPNKYPQSFERNKPVRAVNLFRFETAKMFYMNYFEQNWYGEDAAFSIKNDILTMIKQMSADGIFLPPASQDVKVTNLGARSYSAEVKLKTPESPEILYVTLEV